jgi:hypothetical protein
MLSACASMGRQPSGSSATSAPFIASSMHTVYGVQARLEGTISRRNDWIDVVISRGTLQTFQRDPQQYWDLRLRTGLAHCLPSGEWDVASESRATRLAPAFGEEASPAKLDTATRVLRDTLRFEVAVPPTIAVQEAWVVLVFEWPFENAFATYNLSTGVQLAVLGEGRSRPVAADATGEAPGRPKCS